MENSNVITRTNPPGIIVEYASTDKEEISIQLENPNLHTDINNTVN